MTTDSQRQQAETIAAEMAKLPGIASAVVDDWDDFGGFNLFIRLTTGGSNSQFIKFLVPLNGIVLKLRSIAQARRRVGVASASKASLQLRGATATEVLGRLRHGFV